MNVWRSNPGSAPSGGQGEASTALTRLFLGVSIPDLVRALVAILFWSLLISAVSCCYELWRFKRNWRPGIA